MLSSPMLGKMCHRSSSFRRPSRLTLALLLVLGLAGGRAIHAQATSAAAAKPKATAVDAKAKVKPKAGPVHERREIHTFTTAQIDAFRKGVAKMQSRPYTDPTSWIYQANMHGYPTSSSICPVIGTPQPQWSTCQHGSFFFLAWHRMYLYYFERILRAAVREATGDPNYEFALPYWDYENPGNHALPAPYRVPGDTSNPLWVKERRANCNSGAECVSAATASDTVAMGLIPFCSCPSGTTCPGCTAGLVSDESFGGQYTSAPVHSGSGPGELELQPHGAVHNAVGGPTGWMSYFTCAARDPIFWAHHANIDRLWQVWLNQLGGRKNPITNTEWATQKFTFFNEKKEAVTLTGCEILNMVTQLDYRYQGLAVNNIQLCGSAAVPEAPAKEAPAAKLLAASAAAETRLGGSPVSVDVELPDTARQRVDAIAAHPAATHLHLQIEGIKLLAPGAVYQVYVNLPSGKAPDPKSPSYLGNLALFTDPEHAGEVTRTYDLSRKMKALRAAGLWKNGPVHLTFVLEDLEHKGAAAAAATATRAEFIRFTKVSLVEQ